MAYFNIPIQKFTWSGCRNSLKEFVVMPNQDLNPERRDMKWFNNYT